MSPENWKRIENLVTIAVTTFATAIISWLIANGYLKEDIEAAVATGVQQVTTKQDAAVEQITAQTNEQTEVLKVKADEQTEVLAAETKAQAVKTRKKVTEETNEVIAKAETTEAERVEAAPAMQGQRTDPAIAELLLDLTARMEKLEKEAVTP